MRHALQYGEDLAAAMRRHERCILAQALRDETTVKAAAERLGISERGMYKKMARLEVRVAMEEIP